MNEFETIDDKALEQVTGGGLSFSIGSFSLSADLENGLSAEGPLGSLSVPSPITVAQDVISESTGALSDLLTRFADRLSSLGQLFDFS